MNEFKEVISLAKENIRMGIKFIKKVYMFNKLPKMRRKFDVLDNSKEMGIEYIIKIIIETDILFKKKYIPKITDKIVNNPELYLFIDDFTQTIVENMYRHKTLENKCSYSTIHDVVLGVVEILLKPSHTKYRDIFSDEFE